VGDALTMSGQLTTELDFEQVAGVTAHHDVHICRAPARAKSNIRRKVTCLNEPVNSSSLSPRRFASPWGKYVRISIM
jgi:hypothetical protein